VSTGDWEPTRAAQSLHLDALAVLAPHASFLPRDAHAPRDSPRLASHHGEPAMGKIQRWTVVDRIQRRTAMDMIQGQPVVGMIQWEQQTVVPGRFVAVSVSQCHSVIASENQHLEELATNRK